MHVYLVGGAVRDGLLGLAVGERDWVVLGATPEDMRARGYKPVGRDFPVFLHPETSEEYALARTERKRGRGYHGFVFHTGPDVTLEDDLRRRDLTINAMAEDEQGRLIDPFGGQADLCNKCLRHVSPAFQEDPVRILRLARFAARFHSLGFRVAEETIALMRAMVAAGEAGALVPERVWRETRRSLAQDHPGVYFRVLRECGALGEVFPEIDRLFGVPQRAEYHPEIDAGVHTLMVLEQAVRLGADNETRFAALCHDLGKADTPREEWPAHKGHEERGGARVEDLCARLKVPKAYRRLARTVAEQHLLAHRARELKPATLVGLLERLGAFRDSAFLERFLLACEADARGRAGFETKPYPQAAFLRAALAAANTVQAKEVVTDGYSGRQVGEQLHVRRVRAVKQMPGG
jgi:tRNA nucleotidyltransferase (CCA-adding enzyme)